MKTTIKKILSVILALAIFVVPASMLKANAGVTLVWPVPGHTHLTGTFSSSHQAIDISDGSIAGATVVCAMGGVVERIYLCGNNHQNLGDCSGFGTGIVIRGDDGRHYQYAHMEAGSIPSNVYYNAYVPTGAQVGRVGNTGWSTGPHLHFQIGTTGIFEGCVDPMLETYGNQDPAPADIGTDFYALILNTSSWKPISKKLWTNNISLESENGTSMQKWHFSRQSDGAYVIRSCYDGKVLEMRDGIRNNCTPIVAKDTFWGGYYQQWYLIPQGNGYVFLNKHYTDEQWVLDLYENDSSDGNKVEIYQRNNSSAQIWSVYAGADVQLSAPTLSVSVDAPNADFSWNEVYGESDYVMKIWKNKNCEGEAYRTFFASKPGASEALPGGTYYARLTVYDHFNTYYSNVVEINMPAVTYTVTYDANGGQNAPEPQTKLPGEILRMVVSGDIPTRNGYKFLGWSKDKGATVPQYADGYGPFYTGNSDVTFYAVWEKVDEPATEPTTQPVPTTTKPVPSTTKPATEPTEPATKPTEPSTAPSVPSTTAPSTEDESNNKYGLFTYRIVNGEAEIISCDSGATGKVIIPSEIEGCPVTVLGNKSFYQCSDISNLIIPDTVKKIGDYAFNCGFESVMIPESVTEIGYRAFQDCWNIKKINIDENNKNYSSDEYGVLFNKDKTELIYFPCWNEKTSYDIPESVVKIWESAFFCALDLEYVYISKNVSDIQIFQFTCCYNLKGIIVDEENEAYSCDKNGVLFNKDKTVLIRYPLGSEETKYTIPESVTEFEIDAFSEAVNLESVVIPEGVEEIGYCTFADCHKLKSVILPEGIRVIGDQAFVFCESLENIYIPYGAAKIEWLAFRGCTSLEYVHIPETVGYIGETILLETDNVYICSYTEDCYAKMYAEDNGYEFRLCDNHGSPIPEPTTQPVPTTTQTMPSSTQPAPTTTQSVPTTTQSVPTTTQSVPTTTQSVPTTTQSVPTTTQPMPTTTQPMPTTTQPMPTTTQPEPTTNKDVTVTDPDNSDISPELFDKDLIRTPSTTVIKYADSIILHADLKNYPAGSKVEWSMNNGNFEIVDISEDSLTCVITPKSNGDAVFTAIVYGEDGEVLGTDTQKMTSKAGFFNKIFGFFRRIFGLTKIIPNAIKFAF